MTSQLEQWTDSLGTGQSLTLWDSSPQRVHHLTLLGWTFGFPSLFPLPPEDDLFGLAPLGVVLLGLGCPEEAWAPPELV